MEEKNPNAEIATSAPTRSLEELKEEIGMYSCDIDLNLPYVPLLLIMKECGIKQEYANMLLQYHGYRDHDGIWSKQLIGHGYVETPSFTLCEYTRLLYTRYNNEIVAPHAIEFFKVFFKKATLD